jgi:hypothetical protein
MRKHHFNGECIFYVNIVHQEARTPAVFHTVMESLQKRLAVDQSVKRLSQLRFELDSRSIRH